MLTYQDLIAVGDGESELAEFTRKAITEHKRSNLYAVAKAADDYDRGLNTTITNYQRTVTTLTGQKVNDPFSPNHRSASNFFNIFTTQLNQYLLGNGVKWAKEDTEQKLGADFDNRLSEAGKKALCGGVAFGFWDYDHMTVFSVLNFAPFDDEETGALRAGIRYWQIAENKPLRATLYAEDGFIDFLWATDTKMIVSERWHQVSSEVYCVSKRPYIVTVARTEADGEEIVDGRNYPSFPIVPLYANPHKQSELVGLREKIDAYDMMLSGFANDLDNAQIYWIIKGAGGMDDPDLVQFLDRLRTVKAAAPADGQEIGAVTVEIPHEAREKLLDRLESQLYKDAMIMNPEDIRGGAITATQIRAAYERQNVKADQFEYCVLDFLSSICALAGVQDNPTFTRSTIVNTQEEIQTLVQAAPYLGQEYTTKKILTLLGDGDQAEEVLKQVDAESAERLNFEE